MCIFEVETLGSWLKRLSPEGTAESATVNRPFGTESCGNAYPALKRWAIVICPSGTGGCMSLWPAFPPILHPTAPRPRPEPHRDLPVVRLSLIFKQRLTCWRFLRFAARDLQAAKPRVWQVRCNSARRVR